MEMKKDRVYNLTLRISVETSSVIFAECSYLTGRGTHDSCKHLGAILFALETSTHFMRKQDQRMKFVALQNCRNGTNLESDGWTHNLPKKSVLKSNNMIISRVVSKDFFDPQTIKSAKNY